MAAASDIFPPCTEPEGFHLRGLSFAREAAGAEGRERAAILRAAAEAFEAALRFEGSSAARPILPGAGSFASWNGLGGVHLAQGRLSEAQACFGRALMTRPGDRDARLGLAEVGLSRGDAAGAMVVLERLLDERPDGWVLAAAAARALRPSHPLTTLLRRARERVERGYVAPHRAGMLSRLAG